MLTSERLDELDAHFRAGDRIAYYKQLDAWGLAYGELALGVVQHDTLSGRTANHYFLGQANAERAANGQPPVTNDELARIGLRLMEEDFRARESIQNYTGDRLKVSVVLGYHERVFAEFNVSPAAWTPYMYLMSYPEEQREAVWDGILGSDGFLSGSDLNRFISTRMSSDEFYHWTPQQLIDLGIELTGFIYQDNVDRAGIFAGAGQALSFMGSFPFGDYAVRSGDTQVIGGTPNADELTLISGATAMGFDGNDTIEGSGGSDRMYGGRGRDELHVGEGDRAHGGRGRDDVRFGSVGFGEAAWLDGGAGRDVLDLSDAEEPLSVTWEPETDEDAAFSDDPTGSTVVIAALDGGGEAHRGTSFEVVRTGGGADLIDASGFSFEEGGGTAAPPDLRVTSCGSGRG